MQLAKHKACHACIWLKTHQKCPTKRPIAKFFDTSLSPINNKIPATLSRTGLFYEQDARSRREYPCCCHRLVLPETYGMILAYHISCCQHFFTGSGGAVRHEHRFFHSALPGAAHVPQYDGILRSHRLAVRQYGHRGGISSFPAGRGCRRTDLCSGYHGRFRTGGTQGAGRDQRGHGGTHQEVPGDDA